MVNGQGKLEQAVQEELEGAVGREVARMSTHRHGWLPSKLYTCAHVLIFAVMKDGAIL